MAYQVAQNHDNAVGLVNMVVQPKMPGIRGGAREWAADGFQYENGWKLCELSFGFMTTTQLSSLLTQFGLSETTLSAEITIRLPANITRTATNYNATAHIMNFPDESEYMGTGFWGDLKILITDIEGI